MNIDEIKTAIKELKKSKDFGLVLTKLEHEIINNKKVAVDSNNQELAKEYWVIQQILEANKYYINSFENFKNGEFYKGWCNLEKAELRIHFLSRHYDISCDEYYINFINQQLRKFQSIFPYKVFFSTELLEKKIQCSICDAVITPRKRCEHIQGEIYNGEMCSRHITDAEVLGLAIVDNPVHKYSVAFLSTEKGEQKDQYDYSLLNYLIPRLESPYEFWNVELTKRRHPHSNFNFVGRNDKCPCGSGKKYKKCCLEESGVLMPHAEFILEKMKKEDIGKIEYTYLNREKIS